MIIGVICICQQCKKQFIIHIHDGNLEPDDIPIFNKWICPKCKEKEMLNRGKQCLKKGL